MDYEAQIAANLSVSGVFEFHDAQGNLVGTAEVSGSVPLTTSEQVEQAQALIKAQGGQDGQLRE